MRRSLLVPRLTILLVTASLLPFALGGAARSAAAGATQLAWSWPWADAQGEKPLAGQPAGATQVAPPASPQYIALENLETTNVLDATRTLGSACSDAAWTLWYSNRYEAWRKGRAPVLSLNYSVRTYESLPPVSPLFAAELRERLDQAMAKANDIIKQSLPVFKDMANYINAKDYEGDKFKKGDALNERLVAFGRSCFAIAGDLQALYAEAATAAIERALPRATQPELARTMIADWRAARPLADELAKEAAADPARLAELTTAVSALAEKRRAELAAEIADTSSPVGRFYDDGLNGNVAVRMRKTLRELKGADALKEAADGPRSDFLTVRQTIDLQLPGEILRFITR